MMAPGPANGTIELIRGQVWDNGKPSKPYYSRHAFELELWVAPGPHDIKRPGWKQYASLFHRDVFSTKLDRLLTKGSISREFHDQLGEAYRTGNALTHMGMFYTKTGGGTHFFDRTFAMVDIDAGVIGDGYVVIGPDVIGLPVFATTTMGGGSLHAKVMGQSRSDRIAWSLGFATGPEK